MSIIWNYNGFVPKEMSDRIVSITERNLTTVVDNIGHVESQSLKASPSSKCSSTPTSMDWPCADYGQSQTQPAVAAGHDSSVHSGVQRIQCSDNSAGSLGRESSEQQLNDHASNFLRTQLTTVPGSAFLSVRRQAAPGSGGSQPRGTATKGLSPRCRQRNRAQNLILPPEHVKIGSKENDVDMNAVLKPSGNERPADQKRR